MKRKHLVAILVIFSFLTVNAAAQTGFDGSTNPLGDSLDSFFQSVSDQVEWYEGDGIGSFLLWIVVPAVGMYAIFRFTYSKAFHFAEENFRDNSGIGSSSGISDMGDSMSKLLAISTSIIALVFWGDFLGSAMIIAGLAGIVWFAWANAAGLRGTTSPLPFGGSEDNSSGNDNSSGSSDDGTDEVNNEVEESRENESQAQEDIDESREEAGSGDTAAADQDARKAAEELETALQEQEDATQKLEAIMEKDLSEIKQTISELEQTLDLEEEEEKIINNLQNELENIEGSQISGEEGLLTWIKNLENYDNPRELEYAKNAIEKTLRNIESDLENMATYSKRLRSEAQEEESEIEQEIQEVTSEIGTLVRAHKIIQKLKQVEKIADEEEEELEQLDQRLGDQELASIIQKMKEQESMLFDQEKGLEEKEQEIEEVLEAAESLFDRIRQIDEKEIEQLDQEETEEEKIESQIKDLMENNSALMNNFGGSVNQFQDSDLYAEFDQIMTHLEEIRQSMAPVVKVKRIEDEEIQEAETNLEDILSQIRS